MVKMTAVDSASTFDPIPDQTILNAKLKEIVEFEYEYDNDEGNRETAEAYRWIFEVTEVGLWQGWTLRGKTSRKFSNHESCKAMNYMVAIAGREFEPDEQLETEDYYGYPCRIIIEEGLPDANGKIWNNVVEVLPSPSSVSAKDVFG